MFACRMSPLIFDVLHFAFSIVQHYYIIIKKWLTLILCARSIMQWWWWRHLSARTYNINWRVHFSWREYTFYLCVPCSAYHKSVFTTIYKQISESSYKWINYKHDKKCMRLYNFFVYEIWFYMSYYCIVVL